jgi:hypothetical protein
MRYFVKQQTKLHFQDDGSVSYLALNKWDLPERTTFAALMQQYEKLYAEQKKTQSQVDRLKQHLAITMAQSMDPNYILFEFETNIRICRNSIAYKKEHRGQIVGVDKVNLLHRLIEKNEGAPVNNDVPIYTVKILKQDEFNGVEWPNRIIVQKKDCIEDVSVLRISNLLKMLEDKYGADYADNIETIIAETLGIYITGSEKKMRYLSLFGLKAEAAEVIEEPAPVKIPKYYDPDVIAKAQAIWRGTKDRHEMKIDRSNLVCRFWKRFEDSRARVSIRKGKTTKKLYKTTHKKMTEIKQPIVTKTTGVKRDGKQIGRLVEKNEVAKKEEKVNVEDDTQV